MLDTADGIILALNALHYPPASARANGPALLRASADIEKVQVPFLRGEA